MSDAGRMRAINFLLPPKIAAAMFALVCCLWAIQHPDSASASVQNSSSLDWRLPVAAPATVVAPYSAPKTSYSAGHRGIDIAVEPDQELFAPESGIVAFSALVAGKPVVAIEHANGFRSAFEPACATVELGASVGLGEPFARACSSITYQSHCNQFCLHYSLRHSNDYLSPLGAAGALPPSHLVKSDL